MANHGSRKWLGLLLSVIFANLALGLSGWRGAAESTLVWILAILFVLFIIMYARSRGR